MSKSKMTEICIQESRAFFGNLLADMVGNICGGEIISESDRKSLNILQNVWIQKYNPDRRMPDKLPISTEGSQVKKAKSQTKSQEASSLIAKVNILESNFEELKKIEDNKRIIVEIGVPKLCDHWTCTAYMVTVPARVAKENKLEPLLTMDLLHSLSSLSVETANKLLQEVIDNEFNSEIDDALVHG